MVLQTFKTDSLFVLDKLFQGASTITTLFYYDSVFLQRTCQMPALCLKAYALADAWLGGLASSRSSKVCLMFQSGGIKLRSDKAENQTSMAGVVHIDNSRPYLSSALQLCWDKKKTWSHHILRLATWPKSKNLPHVRFIEASPGLSCAFNYRYLLTSSVFHHNLSGLRLMQRITSRDLETDLYSLQKILLIKLSQHLLTPQHTFRNQSYVIHNLYSSRNLIN